MILDAFSWLYSMEHSRGNNNVSVHDLGSFKAAWQKYDIINTGNINNEHSKPFVEEVGESFGRPDASAMWFKVLDAQIAVILASNKNEVSFRDLFVVLTTKVIGADASRLGVDCEIETNVEKVDEQLWAYHTC